MATGTIADDDGSARGQIRASYAFGLSRLAMQDHVDGMRWVCTDPLGSTADLVANDGSLVHALTYDPYGNPETIFGDSWNRHTFTDHEYDPESGLYYAKARFYDPDLGNFTSADKWQFVDFNNGRGRNAPFGAPPAQIPACATNALGSSLGFWRRIAPMASDV